MHLSLVANERGPGKRERVERIRNPVDVIHKCPKCGSKNLLKLNVDVLCGHCDWDSTWAYVAAGGMDHLLAAARDHFIGPPKPLTDPENQNEIENQPLTGSEA